MPGMNGLEFLDKIMRLRPMRVVMLSTLTGRDADTSIRSLELLFASVAKAAGAEAIGLLLAPDTEDGGAGMKALLAGAGDGLTRSRADS
jgi:chemotaxis response regulator CheB